MAPRTIYGLIAFAALTHGQAVNHKLWVIPKTNDTDTGGLIMRELRANGAHNVEISPPDSITASYRIKLPGAQGSGALTNDGSGNLSWSASGLSGWTIDGSLNLYPNTDDAQDLGDFGQFVKRFFVKEIHMRSGTGQISLSMPGAESAALGSSSFFAFDNVGSLSATITYQTGQVEARIFNMTGSAYRVSGQSAIDSLRQGRFTNIINAGPNTYISMDQTDGLDNSGGMIKFSRQGTQIAALDYDAIDGYTFHTAAYTGSFGPLTAKWQLDSLGMFFPVANVTYDIGRTGNAVRRVLAETHTALSTGKFSALNGAGSETMKVDSSGFTGYDGAGAQTMAGTGATGQIDANIFNATGTGYRVSGATVIDSTKTIRSGNHYPDGDATRNSGDPTARWNVLYAASIEATTQIRHVTGGVTRVSLSGSGLSIANAANTVVATINGTSGVYSSAGFVGMTATCAAGQTLRQVQVVGGLVVGGACAP